MVDASGNDTEEAPGADDSVAADRPVADTLGSRSPQQDAAVPARAKPVPGSMPSDGSDNPPVRPSLSGKPLDDSSRDLPPEIGGQKGPEPTRYGDWEKNGRCTDF